VVSGERCGCIWARMVDLRAPPATARAGRSARGHERRARSSESQCRRAPPCLPEPKSCSWWAPSCLPRAKVSLKEASRCPPRAKLSLRGGIGMPTWVNNFTLGGIGMPPGVKKRPTLGRVADSWSRLLRSGAGPAAGCARTPQRPTARPRFETRGRALEQVDLPNNRRCRLPRKQGPGQGKPLGIAPVCRRTVSQVPGDPMDLNKWWIHTQGRPWIRSSPTDPAKTGRVRPPRYCSPARETSGRSARCGG